MNLWWSICWRLCTGFGTIPLELPSTRTALALIWSSIYMMLWTLAEKNPPDNKRTDKRYDANDSDRFLYDGSEYGSYYLTMWQSHFFRVKFNLRKVLQAVHGSMAEPVYSQCTNSVLLLFNSIAQYYWTRLYFSNLVIRFLLKYVGCVKGSKVQPPVCSNLFHDPKLDNYLLLFSVLKNKVIPLALYSTTSKTFAAERRPAKIFGWIIPVCHFLVGIVCGNCRKFILDARFRNWSWLTVRSAKETLQYWVTVKSVMSTVSSNAIKQQEVALEVGKQVVRSIGKGFCGEIVDRVGQGRVLDQKSVHPTEPRAMEW